MPKKVTDVPAHFFSKVNKDGPGGCWLWTGYVRKNGYGCFYVDRYPHFAHRWSYEYHKGQIPEELVIDHLCRVRHCVNPDHLEAVTPLTNTLRGAPANQTHCKRGHLYDEANTYYQRGRRTCRTCMRTRLALRHQLERITRKAPAMKTHCKRGHLFDEANTIIDRKGNRNCRACKRMTENARRAAKRSA